MFKKLINLIMGNKNKQKPSDLGGKASVNKDSKEKESAGANTRSHMEEIHGKAIQKGYCDGKGNFIVTEDTVNGKVEKYPLHEVVKTWEKRFPYIKFEDSHVEISEKEEK